MMPPTSVEFHPEAIAEAVAAANWYREREVLAPARLFYLRSTMPSIELPKRLKLGHLIFTALIGFF
jgi:hypothetical protein